MDEYAIILIQSYRNLFLDYLSLFFDYLFSSKVLLVFFLVLFFLFIFKKYKNSFPICFSLASMTVVVKLIKEIVKRPRPEFILDLPITSHSLFSFPSGHTAAAFLIAVLFSKYHPKYKYIFYTIAVLTAFSRIYLGVHYLSDVFFGAVIGILVAFFTLKYEKLIITFGEKIIKLKNTFSFL